MRLHGDVSDEDIAWAISQFIGEFYQTPPVRANVARQVRRKTLFECELMERQGRDLLLRLIVSGGTYVRKLIHDLGVILGVGGHMVELRRVRIGPRTERESTTIQQLQLALHDFRENGVVEGLKRVIRPVEDLLEYLPKIVVLDSAVDAICHGAPVAKPGVAAIEPGITPGMNVGIYTLKGEIIAVGVALQSSQDIIHGGGLVVKTDRVFMARGTYPPLWGKRKSKTS